MPTETVFLTGKCKWVKAHETNQFGDYKFDLYPDSESLSKIMELKSRGLRNVLKNDEQDGPYMAFKRPASKMMRNQVVTFGPPIILDKEGTPTVVAVGNGSDVTAKLIVYEFKAPGGNKGIGARWESLRIDNLVSFSKNQLSPQDEKKTQGLAEFPART